MSSEPRWISKKALLLLHEESHSEFRGAWGLWNEGLLESAILRASNTHIYHPAATLAELVGSYCYGIAQNHSFVDGNKSSAFRPPTLMPSKPCSALPPVRCQSRYWRRGSSETAMRFNQMFAIRKAGRFLLLGPASLELVRPPETLTGRIADIE